MTSYQTPIQVLQPTTLLLIIVVLIQTDSHTQVSAVTPLCSYTIEYECLNDGQWYRCYQCRIIRPQYCQSTGDECDTQKFGKRNPPYKSGGEHPHFHESDDHEMTADEPAAQFPAWLIVLLCLLGVCIILVVCMIVAFCCQQNKRNKRGRTTEKVVVDPKDVDGIPDGQLLLTEDEPTQTSSNSKTDNNAPPNPTEQQEQVPINCIALAPQQPINNKQPNIPTQTTSDATQSAGLIPGSSTTLTNTGQSQQQHQATATAATQQQQNEGGVQQVSSVSSSGSASNPSGALPTQPHHTHDCDCPTCTTGPFNYVTGHALDQNDISSTNSRGTISSKRSMNSLKLQPTPTAAHMAISNK